MLDMALQVTFEARGDDVQLDYCLDCGQIQGKFPLPPAALETPPGA